MQSLVIYLIFTGTILLYAIMFVMILLLIIEHFTKSKNKGVSFIEYKLKDPSAELNEKNTIAPNKIG
jgi:hypothetical protein